MELLFFILTLYVVFFGLCFIISCIHRVKHQQWPDGEEILFGLTKMVPFKRKR